MSPQVRKFALTVHIAVSVGWLGAVVGFLALALAGMTSQDIQMVRSVYLAMEVMGWFVLVPLSVASFLSGLVQSLGTPWGLFRHYWVVAKLMINVFATIVLLIYMQTLSYLGKLATETTLSDTDPHALQTISPVLHAGGALLLLLVATILSVYKPRGLTPHGQRKRRTASLA